MPRPDEGASNKKPSLIKRVLAFFGIGKKKQAPTKDRKKNREANRGEKAPQRVRVVQQKAAPNANGNKGRRRASSVLPTEQARLYVGNLSFEATEAELEDLFKGFGHVRSVEIIYNTRTYRSKGYAFVEMEQLADAQRAAEVLHGQPFMGREMMVSAASEKMDRSEKPQEAKESKEDEPQAPAAASKNRDDDLDADFGEEVVVPLGQSVSGVEPAPAAPAEEQQPQG